MDIEFYGTGTQWTNGGQVTTDLTTSNGVTVNIYAQWKDVWAENLAYDNTNTGVNCTDAQCMLDYLSLITRNIDSRYNKIFADSENIYFFYNGKIQAIKYNDYDAEKAHLQQIFDGSDAEFEEESDESSLTVTFGTYDDFYSIYLMNGDLGYGEGVIISYNDVVACQVFDIGNSGLQHFCKQQN